MTVFYHVQCELGNGDRRTTSWIKRSLAEVGNKIRLKEDDGSWSYWTVLTKGAVLPTKTVLARRNAHKNMRKMTDI